MSHVPNLDPDTCAYLRNLAARIYSEKGRGDNTMQPTALLHEAWMKVANSSSKYESREHFLAVAARAMRQILVDRARARLSLKRGGNWDRVTLSGVGDSPDSLLDVLSLDEALKKLAEIDPIAADVAQLRTFGGMNVNETAHALDIATRTVNRKWRFATAVIAKAMQEPE
jgi:RNA polymerase sigma-70 factor (ECF subfamily)